jgi:hypothetical protein
MAVANGVGVLVVGIASATRLTSRTSRVPLARYRRAKRTTIGVSLGTANVVRPWNPPAVVISIV